MSYLTGTATNAADIITAVQNECVANGWTLTNDILSKGTTFVRLYSPSAGNVAVIAGRGQTGGGASTLTGMSNAPANGIGGGTIAGVAFTFPMTYFIHVGTAPDEVTLVVKYNGVYYQRLQFGQIVCPGLVGTGNYYDASREVAGPNLSHLDPRVTLGVGSTGYKHLPFSNYPGFVADGGLDHSLDADPTWTGVRGTWSVDALLINSPNAWNGEAVLIPAQLIVGRPSGFYSVVGEFANLRYVLIDNLDPEQIITIGPDKWKTYPAWKKGARTSNNNSGEAVVDSGTIGFAVRYDGP